MKVGATEALDDLSTKIIEVNPTVEEARNIQLKIASTNQIDVTLMVTTVMVINHSTHHVTNILTSRAIKALFPDSKTIEIKIDISLEAEVDVVQGQEEGVAEFVTNPEVIILKLVLQRMNLKSQFLNPKTTPSLLNHLINDFNWLTN